MTEVSEKFGNLRKLPKLLTLQVRGFELELEPPS